MSKKRVLVSWIGHADLQAMAVGQPESVRQMVKDVTGNLRAHIGVGPVGTLLENEQFDMVFLLSDYPDELGERYCKWLGKKATARRVNLTNPTDYSEIFVKVDRELAAITSELGDKDAQLCILLSRGTPAMAAVWVLLGKSKYPASFYQTYDRKAWQTDIPFDLAVDFVPELLRGPDSSLQHLAARSPQEIEGFEAIIGNSKAIRFAVGRAQKAALRDVPILLAGESGTGKELFARAIHAASHRRHAPFVPLNCAAIPEPLLESELFGHVKGSFTGATKDRAGAFKRADGGILFLDEISECSAAIQAKLLRVLEPPPSEGPCAREYYPVGSDIAERSDVRVLAATNQILAEAVGRNRFRGDLYYRLAVITINLPPLRDRTGDIPLLAEVLLEQINSDFAKSEPGYRHKTLSVATNRFVRRHTWPGNVRELRNVLLQAAVMSDADELREADLSAAIAAPAGEAKASRFDDPLGHGFNLEELLRDVQTHFLKRAMKEASGVKSHAARLLGMKNYQTLDAQIKRLKVDWEG